MVPNYQATLILFNLTHKICLELFLQLTVHTIKMTFHHVLNLSSFCRGLGQINSSFSDNLSIYWGKRKKMSTEVITRRYYAKKNWFDKNLQNWQESSCAGVFFLIKLVGKGKLLSKQRHFTSIFSKPFRSITNSLTLKRLRKGGGEGKESVWPPPPLWFFKNCIL